MTLGAVKPYLSSNLTSNHRFEVFFIYRNLIPKSLRTQFLRSCGSFYSDLYPSTLSHFISKAFMVSVGLYKMTKKGIE